MTAGQTTGGLRFAVKRRGGASVAYAALTIRCGTRDEAGYPLGTAHFTEHCLFKGTEDRKASAINSCLERVGGDLNAYTNKEEIVLHATVLKEDIRKAVRLLLEMATRPTFPQAEVETEKGVVIEEINSYKDSPSDDIWDRFEEMLFSGHPLGGRILGTAASVRKVTPAMLRDFTAERFVPGRMALTVVADIDEGKMAANLLKDAERYLADTLGTVSADPTPIDGPGSSPTTEYRSPERAIFDKSIEKRNHEADTIIGGLAPSLYAGRERMALSLLCNILGGPGSNSILNSRLREKHGWVYGIETWYNQYADTGSVGVSFGCERSNTERCCEEIAKVLDRVREKPFSDSYLKAAKKQLLGQLAISSDFGESRCLSMGKQLMSFGRVSTREELRSGYESLTSADLLDVARSVFDPSKLSRLSYM